MLPLMWAGGKIKAHEPNGIWLALKVAFIWSQMIFLNVQCARYWLADGPTTSKLFLLFQTSVYSAHAVNLSIIILHPRLIAAMMNNSLELQRRHGGLQDKEKVPCLVLKVTLFLTLFAPLTFVARILKDPNNPRSLLSLSADPTTVAWPWKIICPAYQLYSIASIASTLWLTASTVTVFLTTLTKIIEAIKKIGNELLVKAINETAMLLIWFNSIFRYWTLVWEATFIWVLVIDFTMAVVQQSMRDLLVASCIGTMMMYLYKSMGAIYEDSKEIMNVAMTETSNGSWFKRKLRAYRALRVNAGSFYFVDKGLILTMLSIVMQNTANLIITLRET